MNQYCEPVTNTTKEISVAAASCQARQFEGTYKFLHKKRACPTRNPSVRHQLANSQETRARGVRMMNSATKNRRQTAWFKSGICPSSQVLNSGNTRPYLLSLTVMSTKNTLFYGEAKIILISKKIDRRQNTFEITGKI